MMALQKERGVNPLAGCLPILPQIPVFIALFHVLRRLDAGVPRGSTAGPTELTQQAADGQAVRRADLGLVQHAASPSRAQILGIPASATPTSGSSASS